MGGGGARKAWHIGDEINIFSYSIMYLYLHILCGSNNTYII